MCKAHPAYVVQMVIVVTEEIVVNLVIWYIFLFFLEKTELFIFGFRVLMVYKDRKGKKVIVVHPVHR